MSEGEATESGVQTQEPAENVNTQAEQGQVVGITATEDTGITVGSQSEWYWKDGFVGSGDKPEWLREKYKTVEDQAKAYTDAEKLIGQLRQRAGAFSGAPDEYDLSSLEQDFEFDKQHPLLNEFMTECKNANVNQDFALKIAGLAKNLILSNEPNTEEVIKEYGDTWDQDRVQMDQWINNHAGKEEYAEALKGVLTNAKALKALRNCMNATSGNIPTHDLPPPAPKMTLDDLKRQMAENLYQGENYAENPDKAAELLKKFNEIV